MLEKRALNRADAFTRTAASLICKCLIPVNTQRRAESGGGFDIDFLKNRGR
jgi:hypothetical protein